MTTTIDLNDAQKEQVIDIASGQAQAIESASALVTSDDRADRKARRQRTPSPKTAGRRMRAWLLALLAACCSTHGILASAQVAGDPRPVGVPENATSQDRGREVLRVAIELVRHGNLRDTEFASRLLKIPIVPDEGIALRDSTEFPQKLMKRFAYSFQKFRTRAPSQDEQLLISGDMQLDPSTTCLTLQDFLGSFNREFGIGQEIVPYDYTSPLPPAPPSPMRGWMESLTVDAKPGSLRFSQRMPTRMSVSATVPAGSQCVATIGLMSTARR